MKKQKLTYDSARYEEGKWLATNDIIAGDVIRWSEAIWSGSYNYRPRKIGERTIVAFVVNESYGETGQHTFTLQILDCTNDVSEEKLQTGATIFRKGRTLYRTAQRLAWKDEQNRDTIAVEKHERGTLAREKRRWRRELSYQNIFMFGLPCEQGTRK